MNAPTVLLTAQEAARRTGLSPSSITRLAESGDLRFETIGARKVYAEHHVDAYMQENGLSVAPGDHVRIGTDLPEVTAVSFFSGAGGLDLGFEREGIPMLMFSEIDRHARATLHLNHPKVGLVGNISKLDKDAVFNYAQVPESRGIDIMVGGPPCQAFSTAGARRAFDDERGNVFLDFIDLAAQVRPKYLVIENVRGLLSTPFPVGKGKKPVKGGAMAMVLQRLKDAGYTASFNLYNAANFGAPQSRERVIIIAKLGSDRVPWLTPTHSDDPKWKLPKWVTFAEGTKHLKNATHRHTQFPEKRLRFFRLLKQGQYWKDLPADLQEEALGKAYHLGGGKTGFYRRINPNLPSPTLVTSPTMPATDLCHPTELRPLSVEEYGALQGFPKSWKFSGKISDIYRQIGNAVPVELGRAVARAVLADMSGQPVVELEGFKYSRYINSSDKTWALKK